VTLCVCLFLVSLMVYDMLNTIDIKLLFTLVLYRLLVLLWES